MNISPKTVSNILKDRHEYIYTSSEVVKAKLNKEVLMYSKQNDFIQSFASLHDAARYMLANNLASCKLTTIRTHISEVCHGKRKRQRGIFGNLRNKMSSPIDVKWWVICTISLMVEL